MARRKKIKNLSEIHSEFHKIYYSDIASIMSAMERKRWVELLKCILVLIAIGVIIPLCVKYSIYSAYSELTTFIAIGSFTSACWFLYSVITGFSNDLKKKCMPSILKAFGKIKWASGENMHGGVQLLSDSQISASELLSVYTHRDDRDVFIGVYKDVPYTITETNLYTIRGSGKHKIYYSVFNGVLINFESNKTIKNKTIITTKNDFNIKGRDFSIIIALLLIAQGFLPLLFMSNVSILKSPFFIFLAIFSAIVLLLLVCYLLKSKSKEVLNEIKLEDVKFAKRFKAYSSDEVEGRYLLTTAFLDRFTNMQNAFGARNVKCSFYNNDIMFALSTRRNLFEIGNIFTPLTTTKHMKRFFNELSSIMEMIEYFKLDEKTGL